MNREQKISCVKALANLYDNGKIELVWRRESSGVRSTVELNEELSQLGLNVNEQEFVRVAFDVMRIARAISIGEEITDEESALVEAVKEHFLQGNKNLLDFINVHSTSLVGTLDDIDYEILTKRKKSNPKETLSHTVMVKFYVTDTDERDRTTKQIPVELTKGELEDLISLFSSIHSYLSELDRE